MVDSEDKAEKDEKNPSDIEAQKGAPLPTTVVGHCATGDGRPIPAAAAVGLVAGGAEIGTGIATGRAPLQRQASLRSDDPPGYRVVVGGARVQIYALSLPITMWWKLLDKGLVVSPGIV